jgi:hypothetical protein
LANALRVVQYSDPLLNRQIRHIGNTCHMPMRITAWYVKWLGLWPP